MRRWDDMPLHTLTVSASVTAALEGPVPAVSATRPDSVIVMMCIKSGADV
jgi:hypothetical protein